MIIYHIEYLIENQKIIDTVQYSGYEEDGKHI